MLLTSIFSKQNSAISLKKCVLVFKVFTTATRMLKVNIQEKEGSACLIVSMPLVLAYVRKFMNQFVPNLA